MKLDTRDRTSSPCGLRSKAGGRTEAFTAENVEHAESGMESLMLHLSDLGVLSECNERAREEAYASARVCGLEVVSLIRKADT
jgi:hypothetical protein